LAKWWCGFVTTGAVLEVAMAAFTTSEWKWHDSCMPPPTRRCRGDSAYGTYVDLACVQ